MCFKVLYVLFLTCQLLYGSFYIGGVVTPRQLMTIVMFIACYRIGMIKLDKYWGLYLIFIIFYGMSSALTGYFSQYSRQLIGFYMTAYVAYQSTKVIVGKYKAEALIFYTFAAIGLFDAIVTIGQYLYMPWANDVVQVFHFEGSENLSEFQDFHESLEGYTVPGIVGDVMNGYFLPLACIFVWYNRNVMFRFLNFLLWSIVMVGLFFVQQRTGFATGIVASIFIMYQLLSNRMGFVAKALFFIFTIIALSVFWIYGSEFVEESGSRYALGGDMSTRSDLYSRCIDYIFDNPWGGIFDCGNKVGMPHNLFLNAFIYGGYIGGLFVLYIIFEQFKICVRELIHINVRENFALLLVILAWFSFFICSLAHNLSIVTGDVHVWIFWAAIICLIERDAINSQTSLLSLKRR